MSSSLASPPTTTAPVLDPMIEFTYRHLESTKSVYPAGEGPGGMPAFYDRDTGDEVSTDRAYDFAASSLAVDAFEFYPSLVFALEEAGTDTFVTTSGIPVSSSWISGVAELIAAGDPADILDLVLGTDRIEDVDLHLSLTTCADDTVVLTWDSRALDVRRFLFLRPATSDERSRIVPDSHPDSVSRGRGVFAIHSPRYTDRV